MGRRLKAFGLTLLTVALVAAGALLLAGCGDGDGAPSAWPSPAGTEMAGATPGVTPGAALPRPTTTPVITDNLFEYAERGYSVRFPEGWLPRPNLLVQPRLTTDAFFHAGEDGAITANISVTCQVLPEDTTAQAYFDDKLSTIRAVSESLVGAEPVVETIQVAGVEALRVTSTGATRANPPADKVDVLLRTDRCGWSIVLVVPAGELGQYDALFGQFLTSFTLLPGP